MAEEKNQTTTATTDTASTASAAAPTRTLWGDAWKRLRRNKLAMGGLIWIILMVVITLSADLWVPQVLGSPTQSDSSNMAAVSRLAPSLEHPFGTDTLGRDVLSRVIYGARISLSVGLLATAISTIIGLFMGAMAAYYGGIWDTIIMRLADVFLAFPYILFVITLSLIHI